MITVTYACGHRETVKDDGNPPSCSVCGETRVQAVKAPTPTFRGVASGPCCEGRS